MFECFDFRKLYLIWGPDYKSRIWKKYFYSYHYHLNLFIRCKTKLKIKFIFYWMSLFKQNEYYYRVKFLFNRINFFETGYKYLFWIHNFIWKKKRVLLRKIFVKIIDVFFLKIYFFSKKFCYIWTTIARWLWCYV